MGLTTTKYCDSKYCECNLTLQYKQERTDIKNLLIQLNNGISINEIFPKNIADHVKAMLVKDGLIDNYSQLTLKGNTFIRKPFKLTCEKGVFSLTAYYVNMYSFGYGKYLIPALTRSFSDKDLKSEIASQKELFTENEFCFNEANEKGFLDNIIANSKCYFEEGVGERITFSIIDGTYIYNGKTLQCGESLRRALFEEAESRFQETSEINYDIYNNVVIVDEIEKITFSDLMEGKLTSKSIDDYELKDIPLSIEDYEIGCKYIYLYLFNMIDNGNYLSISDMSDIFYHEILGGSIFSVSLKDEFKNFKIELGGFKRYLPEDKYEKMKYKLKVMETLLNLKEKIIDKDFTSVRNYDQLFKYISKNITYHNVKRCYLVQGYALSRTSFNRIEDCVSTLKNYVNDITIVDKHKGNSIKVDKRIVENLENQGITIVRNESISELYHDRYIIFEFDDGTETYFLGTSEISEIFHTNSGEPNGYIKLLDNSEVIRENVSLLNRIKGGNK